MFIFVINSINIPLSTKGNTSYTHIIAASKDLNDKILQKVADRVKTKFGVTLNPNNGSTSDPDVFLHIEDVDILD
mgnify:CR=1 FL=1|jgi:hypothetical protein